MLEKLAEKLNKKSSAEDIKFKSFTESVTDDIETKPEPASLERPAPALAPANIELKVTRPESFADVSTVADYLLDGCTVVLNMELMDRASGIRMLDFLGGVTYSLGGDIKNVSPGTYIITPHNIDITD